MIDKHPPRTLRSLVILGLLMAVLASAGTYFTALSQYPTADQKLTASRLQAFITDFRSAELGNGSLVSDLVVAIPGHAIAGLFDLVYRANDPIIGTIRYTPILPFALAQVIVALALIVYLTFLVVRLAIDRPPDVTMHLLALVLLLNFPILKALCKILKYDALSTLFSAIAIVLYIAYRQYHRQPPSAFFGRFCMIAIAVFCSLAYLEKDATLAVVLLIFAFELVTIPFISSSRLEAILAAMRFCVVFVLAFCATALLLVPKVLLDPVALPQLFLNIPLYFANIPPSAPAVFVPVLLIAYAMAPARPDLGKGLATIAPYCLAAAALVIVALATSALLFQQNILYDPTIPGNEIDADSLRAQGIYVSQPIASSAITTLDRSRWVQHLKIFYSMVRAIFYTLPEIIVLMIVLAAPLVIWLKKERSDQTALLLLMFSTAILTAYSLADTPFSPHYLVLASLLLMIFGLFPLLVALSRLREPIAQGVQVALAAIMLLTAFAAGPTYFRYKNAFRDRALDNAAALDEKRYIWWTWAGWGETAYPIARHLEQQNGGPFTVAFDYMPPFYSVPGLHWIDPGFFLKCRSAGDLKTMIANLQAQSVDFVVVSKNMSNRNFCSNFILQRLRGSAVFVDVQQAFEYGWLFRLSDLVESVKK